MKSSAIVEPLFWMLCTQYYIVQLLVARAWKTPFSLRNNTISDLGNTACGLYGIRNVCSPLHGLMNASFLLLGLLMLGGAALVCNRYSKSRAAQIGCVFIGLAGLGSILVGIFPENSIGTLHISGAALSFVFGNLGLISFGYVRDFSPYLRICAFLLGTIALLALVGFMTQTYLGLGIGGMERIVAYPQTMWLIAFAVNELILFQLHDA